MIEPTTSSPTSHPTIDVDECSDGTHSCDANAECTNTRGSYQCECNDGYTGNGFECSNIDECATDTDDCDERAQCTDTEGSYACECPDGWIGDGKVCETASPTASPSEAPSRGPSQGPTSSPVSSLLKHILLLAQDWNAYSPTHNAPIVFMLHLSKSIHLYTLYRLCLQHQTLQKVPVYDHRCHLRYSLQQDLQKVPQYVHRCHRRHSLQQDLLMGHLVDQHHNQLLCLHPISPLQGPPHHSQLAALWCKNCLLVVSLWCVQFGQFVFTNIICFCHLKCKSVRPNWLQTLLN